MLASWFHNIQVGAFGRHTSRGGPSECPRFTVVSSDFASELPEERRGVSTSSSSNLRQSETPRIGYRIPYGKFDVPSNDGRLGEIVSFGLEETAALPFDEEGLDRFELLIGLEEELEADVLYELSAGSRLLCGIGTDEDIVFCVNSFAGSTMRWMQCQKSYCLHIIDNQSRQ